VEELTSHLVLLRREIHHMEAKKGGAEIGSG